MTYKEIKPHTQEELSGISLYINEYISNGATANVFRGKYDGREVAVKTLREGARGGFYSEFEKEAGNMKSIWKGWIARNYAPPQVIPELFASDVKSDFPVLVEEFIEGKRFDHVMRDLPGGIFSEPQALFLASQIGKLLVILHDDLEKSYGDIKFANFLIVGNAKENLEPTLKIFDWNVLGFPTDRNKRRDLLMISNYLLFMLTGEMLIIDHDNLKIEGTLSNINAFVRLTSGTRHFLEKSLHPVSEQRFQSAAEWLETLLNILNWWQQEPSSLLSSTRLEWAQAQRQSSLENAMQALAKAEVLVGRNADGAAELCNTIREEVSGDKVVERIATALWKHNATQAKKYFETAHAQEQYHGIAPVMLWGWLSRAACQMDSYTDYLSQIEESMKARLEGDFDKAANGFRQLLQEFQGNQELAQMQNESEALMLLEEAAEKKPQDELGFDDVITQYEQIAKLAANIPADLLAIAVSAWNPNERLKEAQRRRDDLSAALDLVRQAQRETTTMTARIENIRTALDQTPVQSIILEPLKHMIREALHAGRYEDAEKLSRIPSMQGRDDDWFDSALEAARRLSVLQYRYQGLKVGRPTLKPIADYLSEIDTMYLEEHIFPKSFVEIVRETMKSVRWQSLSDSELEDAGRIVMGMQRLNGQYPEFQKYVEIASSVRNERENARRQMVVETHNLIHEMETDRVNLKALRVLTPSNFEKISSDQIEEEMEQLVAGMLKNIVALERLDPHLPQIVEYIDWLSSSFGLDDWVRVHHRVDDIIRGNSEKLHPQILDYLNTGDLSKAGILLHILGDSGGDDLRNYYEQIKVFLDWGFLLPADEDQALDWIHKDIPLAYWDLKQEGRSVGDYFSGKANAILNDFSINKLPELSFAWWVYQHGGKRAGAQPKTTWEVVEQKAGRQRKWLAGKKADASFLQAIAGLESPLKPNHEKMPDKETLMPWWVWGISGVLVCALAAVVYKFLMPSPGQVPSTLVTSSPPVFTEIPTLTSEPTPVNTPTDTPPVLPSAYLWSPDKLTGVLATLPPNVEFLYLLDDSPAVIYNPETAWLIKPDDQSRDGVGVGGSLRYINNPQKLNLGEAFVEWKMDVPLDRTGLYAFYIDDTLDFSGNTNASTYNLFIEGEDTPRTPYFGESSIKQIFKSKQTEDIWRGVGMYFLTEGDIITVRVKVPELGANDMFAADALAIAFVPDIDLNMPYLLHVPDGRKILYWADDDQVKANPADGWQEIVEPATWLGAHSIDLATGNEASVTWTFTERFSPGKYEVFAFIPQEITVDVSFAAKLDDYQKLKKDILVESGPGGTYQSLGTVEVTENFKGILEVTMTPKSADKTGIFAYDNVFVVKVED